MRDRILFHIQQEVIGYLQTLDGPGFQITNGDGRLSIMAAGITIIIMAGYGYLILNGALRG